MKIFKKVQGFGGKPSLTYEDCRWCFPRLSWPMIAYLNEIKMKSGRPPFVVGFHWENPPGFNQTSGLSGWYQNLNRSQMSHDYLHIFIFISNHRNIHGSSDLIMKWHAAWKHWGLYWIDPHHHQLTSIKCHTAWKKHWRLIGLIEINGFHWKYPPGLLDQRHFQVAWKSKHMNASSTIWDQIGK